MEELTPITRREVFLAKAAGQEVETPTPVTREEVFLDAIAKGGGGSADDVVLNATTAYDDSNRNYNITITSALPSASDLESYFNGNRSIVLHFSNVSLDARLQPELKEVDSSSGTYYSFIGEGLGFDYDKMKYVIRFKVDHVGTVSYVGKVYIGDKYIVTLTPTSPDFSGTMDKTVAEMTEAYNAGMQIVWRVILSSNEYIDVDVTAVMTNADYDYPSFNAYVIEIVYGVLVYAYIPEVNDGTMQTYYTAVYALTPAS